MNQPPPPLPAPANIVLPIGWNFVPSQPMTFTEFLRDAGPACSDAAAKPHSASASSSAADNFRQFRYKPLGSNYSMDNLVRAGNVSSAQQNLRMVLGLGGVNGGSQSFTMAQGDLQNEIHHVDNAMQANVLEPLHWYLHRFYADFQPFQLARRRWALRYEKQTNTSQLANGRYRQCDFLFYFEVILDNNDTYNADAIVTYHSAPSLNVSRLASKEHRVRVSLFGVEDKRAKAITPQKWTADFFTMQRSIWKANRVVDSTVRTLFPQIAEKYHPDFQCDLWFASDYTNTALIDLTLKSSHNGIRLGLCSSLADAKTKMAEIAIHKMMLWANLGLLV